MHIKHMHEMIEKLTDCTKSAIENDQVSIGRYPIADVVDMIKDLNEASYYASIVKTMEEAKKEDEAEEKYLLNRLKEEYKDEYRQMEERYGEDADRRFYDAYRYKPSGRFAPKGRGTRYGRRSYMEPPYLHMPYDYRYDMEDYDYADAERNRDLDRRSMNRLYFSEPMSERNMPDGYSGRRDGDITGSRVHDAREGKSWEKRRGYMETKEMHKDNTPESKQHRMKDLEAYSKDLTEDVIEMVADASPEERALMRQKIQILAQKIPQ